jgi:hypothetical protein
MNGLINGLVRLRLARAARLQWRPFLEQTRDPAGVQQTVLQTILRRHQDTRFGRDHGFAQIRTPADYAARVPIQTYEDLRPYIERQEQEQTPELVAEQPVLSARTSGSTGSPKYLPILKDTIARHHRSQQIFSCCHAAEVPGLFSGSILAFVSPAIEGLLPTGTPFGSMSGLIYGSMPWLLRRKYLVPAAVFECADHALKYLLIATFALADRSVSYIAGANPSSFLRLTRLIQSAAPQILAAVASGELPGRDALEPATYRSLQAAFRGSRRRAEELERLFATGREVTLAQLWPQLKAVSCWREGNCRVLLPALRRQLPDTVPILEMGYLSSECRGTLPVASLRHLEVPTFHENYFEFIARDDWEAGRSECLTLTEIVPGRAYYVVVTTPDGLYRYFINDIVVAGERYEQTPTIHFLEKGAGVTSLTGEKLYESQVSEAVEALARDRDWLPEFFMLVADPGRQGYHFYTETHTSLGSGFAQELDAAIAARNLEYESKRASDRLRPIELKRLRPGTGEAYKAHLVAQGQREAQFKFSRLQSRDKLTFDLDQHVISPP